MTGRLVDVQRASVHDGPGLRTTVFFKGCPLHCAWCHNPESISFEKEELYYREKCIGCGRCREGCYSGARVSCGRDVTPEELLQEILLDKPFYRNQGGVTFSGGEPLAQKAFLARMIELCKENGIHTAVETSMTIFDRAVFSSLDLIMTDLKLWDEEKHLRYCGGSAKAIRANLLRVSEIGVPIIVRTPVIPGVNDSPEELLPIVEYLAPLSSVQRYELLPYHPLGLEKAKALGKEQTQFSIPSREQMAVLRDTCDLRKMRREKGIQP